MGLFWSFFKIGLFTFGGGYAMIPLIQKEIVDKKRLMEEGEFLEMLAVAQAVPGPISLNTAIFVGNKVSGKKGVLLTALGIILPSFIVILLIAMVFTEFRQQPVVESVFKGMRPAVVALIAAPVWNLGKKSGISRNNIWIPLIVVLLIWLVGVSPVYIVMGVIVLGIGVYLYRKRSE